MAQQLAENRFQAMLDSGEVLPAVAADLCDLAEWMLRDILDDKLDGGTQPGEIFLEFLDFREWRSQELDRNMSDLEAYATSEFLPDEQHKEWFDGLDEKTRGFIFYRDGDGGRLACNMNIQDENAVLDRLGLVSIEFIYRVTCIVRRWLLPRFIVMPTEPCVFKLDGTCFWLLMATYVGDSGMNSGFSTRRDSWKYELECSIDNAGTLSLFEQWLIMERVLLVQAAPDSIRKAFSELAIARSPRYGRLFGFQEDIAPITDQMRWLQDLVNETGWESKRFATTIQEQEIADE